LPRSCRLLGTTAKDGTRPANQPQPLPVPSPVHTQTKTAQLSLDKGAAIKDVPQPAFLRQLAEHEAARRHNAAAAEAAGF
jgi:hypothetical protein